MLSLERLGCWPQQDSSETADAFASLRGVHAQVTEATLKRADQFLSAPTRSGKEVAQRRRPPAGRLARACHDVELVGRQAADDRRQGRRPGQRTEPCPPQAGLGFGVQEAAQFIAAAHVALMTPSALAAAALIAGEASIARSASYSRCKIPRLVPAAQRIRAHYRTVAAAMDDLVARALRERPSIEVVVLAEPQFLIVR